MRGTEASVQRATVGWVGVDTRRGQIKHEWIPSSAWGWQSVEGFLPEQVI
jgi:hypothetical protein